MVSNTGSYTSAGRGGSPAHREGEYAYLMNQRDRDMFAWVRKFNPFDLYSKSKERPNQKEIRTFYEELVSEFLPAKLDW